MKIAIIGAGWYGAHLALVLKKSGHDITLLERNNRIFSQLSGNFGIRLHLGPHYPRSPETRKSCRRGFNEFRSVYPDLVVEHEYAIYGLGHLDADGKPSKIGVTEFRNICNESISSKELIPEIAGYSNLESAWLLDEPSIVLGERLRGIFEQYLIAAGVNTKCNINIDGLEQVEDKVRLSINNDDEIFDYVINATSYQAFLPKPQHSPFELQIGYQPCIALMYEDLESHEKPFSFIIMDGWYPCIMPYIDDYGVKKKYILTHGKWTIMGTYSTPYEAGNILTSLHDEFVFENIKNKIELEINRFWPAFKNRFNYIGWKGEVLAKLNTKSEFRSAVTFQDNKVIHIIPGKVSNIFDVEREVDALLNSRGVVLGDGYQYSEDGVLAKSLDEIKQKSSPEERSTYNLQTYQELNKLGEISPFVTNRVSGYFKLKFYSSVILGSTLIFMSIVLSASACLGYASLLGGLGLFSVGAAAYLKISNQHFNKYKNEEKTNYLTLIDDSCMKMN